MTKNPLHTDNFYSDEQILTAIRTGKDEMAFRWFLEEVRQYAIGFWRKKHYSLSEDDWKDDFTDTTTRLIKSVRNGLTLKEGTRLKSYFTGIGEYVILDFYAQQKKIKTEQGPLIENNTYVLEDAYDFEKEQIALLIRNKLEEITGNAEQVKVLLLLAKGYKYKEILAKTNYQSEVSCRNACLKAKKKMAKYFLAYPAEGKKLRALILQSV